MAYRIALDEPLPDEVRRLAHDQSRSAITGLRAAGAGDRASAVHDARKSIKKTRALLRLVRSGLPAAVWRAENAALREAGRTLSATRDADVLLETLDDLTARYAGRVAQETFVQLRHQLADVAEGDGEDPTAAGIAALEAVDARVDVWRLEACDRAAALAGMTRAYKLGRRARRDADRHASVEALHDWRKRVKDLWYHERLLRDLWPDVFKAQAGQTKHLSELLGTDHDLAVLRERLCAGDAGEPVGIASIDDVVALIDERRHELQAAAQDEGRRIYAEKPGAYRRRVTRLSGAAHGWRGPTPSLP